MKTALHLRARLSLVLAAALVMMGVSVSAPTTASAGTADYHYTCYVPGGATWSIPKGTPLSMCKGGYVYERLNGQLMRVIPLNESGARQTQQVSNTAIISCVAGTVGTVTSVLTLSGGVGWVALGASLTGLAVCKG